MKGMIHMKKLLLIAGHGEGDPGAISKWGKEADLTRELANMVQLSFFNTDLKISMYDQSKDAYQQSKRGNRPLYENYDAVLEIHFNAKVSKDEYGDGRFTGTGGYVHTGTAQSQQIGEKIVKNIEKLGLKRWQIVQGDNLLNMNNCYNLDVPYFLLETAFLDDGDDMAWYNAHKTDVSKAIANGIKDFFGLSKNEPNLTKLEGQAVLSTSQMRAYIKAVNPNVPDSVLKMIPYYISEGAAEGIRGDLAFCQSCLETGNFTFKGSAVTLDQNNFCGLGVTSNGMKGNSFATPQLGIRAQIQHLKAYANKEDLLNSCADPRFHYVTRGCAPYIQWLGIQENPSKKGWASGKGYGDKILKIYKKILLIKEVTEETNPIKSFLVRVSITDLRIRTGAGLAYSMVQFCPVGIYTIVETKAADGYTWGRLKSGAGWIALEYTERI